ncbi:Uu.00g010340.m01.CDS01 [Anthostomella pinea]|uniref:Uu.00g010340.m01.CDS01 n=1 Tax=Anthostomella pinea TaxID=933095 RepID=A0AAI8VYG0_9PEZI|nr:Uu.00g010340.m01.CDS01 [Anthostomella pinea]
MVALSAEAARLLFRVRENAAAGPALQSFELTEADPGVGPVCVEGAEPDDVLRIDFLPLEPSVNFGWTAVFPGFGILSDDAEFAEPALKIWDLRGVRERGCLVFREGQAVDGGRGHPMVPPLDTGGNIDTRCVGEVCGTAVETRMRARVRVFVEKKGKWWVRSPWVLTAAKKQEAEEEEEGAVGKGKGFEQKLEDGREMVCLGVGSDLREATRKAVRGVVDWLEAEKAMTRVEAYMLVSVAGNLRMCEVVDMPNYAIGCAVPLGIFVS